MLYKLTFKKAFGLNTIPADYCLWFLELVNTECNFSIGDKKFTVKIGRFGISEQEKFIISCFFHSNDRELKYIHEILTLDITLNVNLTIPETEQEECPRNKTVDSLVSPFIQDAFNAASRFIDAYRSVKYSLKRGSDDWRNRKLLLIPEMTEAEFKTYLFYQLVTPERTFVGCFSDGRMTISSSTDNALIAQQMQDIVQDEIPLNSKLIVKSWEFLFQEDYRNCVIYAATVLELTIIKTLRRSFVSKSVASISRIDTFLDEVSNRLLCTVILGLIEIGNETLRENIASVFDLRNRLIHGKKKTVSKVEAQTALKVTEDLLEVLAKSC
ncbi:MAG: hypothetical protein ACLQBC_06145 [Syntrophales bacterium]